MKQCWGTSFFLFLFWEFILEKWKGSSLNGTGSIMPNPKAHTNKREKTNKLRLEVEQE